MHIARAEGVLTHGMYVCQCACVQAVPMCEHAFPAARGAYGMAAFSCVFVRLCVSCVCESCRRKAGAAPLVCFMNQAYHHA